MRLYSIVIICCCFLTHHAAALRLIDLFVFGAVDNNPTKCSVSGYAPTGCTAGQCTDCMPRKTFSNATAVCSGLSHTVVLAANGTLWSAGVARFLGRGLGDSNVTCLPQFAQVTWLSAAITNVSCGINSTILLLSNGSVAGFGANEAGQLGITVATFFDVPTIIWDGGAVQQVAASDSVSLLLLMNGTVISAGMGTARGIVTTGGTWSSVGVPCTTMKLAASNTGAIALCQGGLRIYAWGLNDRHQLTANDTTILTTPQASFFSFGSNRQDFPLPVTIFGLGASHMIAVVSNGSTFGRGGNDNGQLGAGLALVEATDFINIPNPWIFSSVALGPLHTIGSTQTRTFAHLGPGLGYGSSRFVVAGSNTACALGTGLTPSQSASFAVFTAFEPTSLMRSSVLSVVTSTHQRNFLFAVYDRTATLSPSSSWTSSTSGSLTSTLSFSPSGSLSQSLSSSITLSMTIATSRTQSCSLRRSSTQSTSVSARLSITSFHDVSRTVTQLTPPLLTSAIVVTEDALVVMGWSKDTNRGGLPAGLLQRRDVDSIIQLRGIAQSFGDTYFGEWLSAATFIVRADARKWNITPGYAVVSVAPLAEIRTASGMSDISPRITKVTILRGASSSGGVATTTGLPPQTLAALIIVTSVVAVAFLLAMVIGMIVYLRRRSQGPPPLNPLSALPPTHPTHQFEVEEA